MTMPIEEGKPAPQFTLKDATGKPVSLKNFRGQHVIVYFYPKDDTPGCTKEACGLRDSWDEIQSGFHHDGTTGPTDTFRPWTKHRPLRPLR